MSDLSQTLQDLVREHGLGLLQERHRLQGFLLDGQKPQQAWLMETAYEADVVGLLLDKNSGVNRRKALKRLQTVYGLAPAAALQIVQALKPRLGQNTRHSGPWRSLAVRQGAWIGLVIALVVLGSVAVVAGGKLFERYQLPALSQAKEDNPRLQVELQQVNYNAEAEQQRLKTQLDEAKLKAQEEAKRQQEAKLKADEEAKRRLEAMKPVMVALKGGCFQMGNSANEANRNNNEQQHQVCVQPFKMGKYEVTQAQWQAVMGSNPSHFKNCGGDCPVEQVSFNRVQAYIATLNQQTGLHYRLPTEAEWEYACRGGKQQTFCGSDSVGTVAWYSDNSSSTTHPVGKKQPNGFGLYDMSGNVWEWTCSAYSEVYDGSEKTCANDADAKRVVRGGS